MGGPRSSAKVSPEFVTADLVRTTLFKNERFPVESSFFLRSVEIAFACRTFNFRRYA